MFLVRGSWFCFLMIEAERKDAFCSADYQSAFAYKSANLNKQLSNNFQFLRTN